MKTNFVNVNKRQELLLSTMRGMDRYDYFAGSDLYVYQFKNDVLVGWLCRTHAWDRGFKEAAEGLAANWSPKTARMQHGGTVGS